MPIPKDYEEILDKLSKATNEGRVVWTAAPFNGIEVLLVSKSRFRIWAGTDEETDAPFVSLALTDEKGKSLDNWFVEAGDTDYDFMYELFKSGTRLANGIPKRLEIIREAISKANIIGLDDDIPF